MNKSKFYSAGYNNDNHDPLGIDKKGFTTIANENQYDSNNVFLVNTLSEKGS
jgi:hypothetical protein